MRESIENQHAGPKLCDALKAKPVQLLTGAITPWTAGTGARDTPLPNAQIAVDTGAARV